MQVVMGAAMAGQVQAAPEGAPFGIPSGEYHRAHACLDQRPRTHRAGFQGHQQGAVIEAPGAQGGGGLPQGHQFRVAQGVLALVTAIAPPANGPPPVIQDHRRHGHLPPLPHPGRPPE